MMLALTAPWEVFQFGEIVRLLDRFPDWRAMGRMLYSGNPLPDDDANHKPRSTQFEMYLAARIAASGYRPIPAEPDICLNLDGWRLGVAAKRVVSLQQVSRRIAEGTKQLRAAKRPGLVVIEVSQALWGRSFSTIDSFDQRYLLLEPLESLVKDVKAELIRVTPDPSLLAVILCGAHRFLDLSPDDSDLLAKPGLIGSFETILTRPPSRKLIRFLNRLESEGYSA